MITEEKIERETTFPIAEMFVSPQGEATFSGTAMAFIRFAGCNVGKPFSKEERAVQPDLKIYQEQCHSWNGSGFACDTNYKMSQKLTLDALLSHSNVQRVNRICLTGGEPLMHDLYPLVEALFLDDKKVHIETSGTKQFRHLQELAKSRDAFLWVCVSPKQGYTEESLAYADELKVLVDETFDFVEFEEVFGDYFDRVWIQPINFKNSINIDNAKRCLEIQAEYPEVRISAQIHKILMCR